jgi:hypothetical protein
MATGAASSLIGENAQAQRQFQTYERKMVKLHLMMRPCLNMLSSLHHLVAVLFSGTGRGSD